MKQFKIQHSFTDRSEKSIEKYFNEVNKYDLIDSEKEVELTKKIKKGNQEAVEELVNANLKFVISVAKQYSQSNMPLSDLISEGNYGLIKAAHKFDETKGFKFISFAVWWIRQSILQYIGENKRLIKLPSNKNNLSSSYVKAVEYLSQILEREPNKGEICEYLEISEKDYEFIRKGNINHSSLDSSISSDENSSTLIEIVENSNSSRPEDVLIEDSLKDDINRVLNVLSVKEKEVLTKLYGIGCKEVSKDQLAKDMSYSSERIRQLNKSALTKLSKNTKVIRLLRQYVV
jgi:RNA polymerase primary sigma factor